MNWKILMSLIVVAAFLAPTASARTVTATYELAFQNLAGSQTDPAGLTSDGSIDYGGVILLALAGETSVAVTVADALGDDEYFVICQDANGNSICGESAAGELRATGCGSGTFALSGTGGQIRVFVSVQNAIAPSIGQQSVTPLPCGTDANVATTGTVTAVFA